MYDDTVTRAEVFSIPTPPPQGPRHRPVPHQDWIWGLDNALAERGLKVTRERLALAGNGELHSGTILLGALDLEYQGPGAEIMSREQLSPTIVYRGGNLQQLSRRIMAGTNCGICSNGCIWGDEIVLKRKHTSGLNLLEELRAGLDRWQAQVNRTPELVEKLRNFRVSDPTVERIFYRLCAKGYLPARFLRPLHETYFTHDPENPTPEIDSSRGTAWGALQTVTRVIRELPLPQKTRHQQTVYGPFALLAGLN
jgi:hypothetical protein